MLHPCPVLAGHEPTMDVHPADPRLVVAGCTCGWTGPTQPAGRDPDRPLDGLFQLHWWAAHAEPLLAAAQYPTTPDDQRDVGRALFWAFGATPHGWPLLRELVDLHRQIAAREGWSPEPAPQPGSGLLFPRNPEHPADVAAAGLLFGRLAQALRDAAADWETLAFDPEWDASIYAEPLPDVDHRDGAGRGLDAG